MSFQTIIKVEKPQKYLDQAFRRGRDKIAVSRQNARGPKIERSKTIELERLRAVTKSLTTTLNRILVSFPAFDTLPEFYKELMKVTLEWSKLKKSLGALKWAAEQINIFHKIYSTKIKRTQQITSVNAFRRMYYGRISSVLKQIEDNLEYLEQTRRLLRTFPSIKQNMPTVALFGFPNVGKTTILTKLTTADPEIAAYPFTTKTLNIGYAKSGSKKVQLIDTPGTLNRFEKMNSIEKQAYLALKHVADSIIYVFDITDLYPLESQKKLYQKVKRLKKPIITYLAKTDLLDKEKIQEFQKKYKALTTIEQLKDYLFSLD